MRAAGFPLPPGIFYIESPNDTQECHVEEDFLRDLKQQKPTVNFFFSQAPSGRGQVLLEGKACFLDPHGTLQRNDFSKYKLFLLMTVHQAVPCTYILMSDQTFTSESKQVFVTKHSNFMQNMIDLESATRINFERLLWSYTSQFKSVNGVFKWEIANMV